MSKAFTSSPLRPALLFRDTRFRGHDTGDHAEHPTRYLAIERELHQRDLLTNRVDVPFAPAPDEAILRVHTPTHLRFLEEATAHGGGWIDSETMIAPDSLETARLAAGAAIAAVDAIHDDRARRAIVLGRPPGHHATRNRAMGFCLLNTIAIAAAHARALGADRVAIIDWDVHHGNGTQDIFYGNGSVLYCSVHQAPLYPGTGNRNETGIDEGEGTTINCPLPAGTGDSGWIDALEKRFAPQIEQFAPNLILLSAGFDAHQNDPLSDTRVTDTGFSTLASSLIDLANRTCDGRIIAVLEGGYDPPTLARNVANLVEMLDHDAT